MTKYIGDRNFESIDKSFSIILSSADPMSFGDFADTLKDFEKIFNVCANECTSRVKGNNKKHNGILVIEDFKTGSLELVVIPFLTGVVSGLVANAIFSVFQHTLRRIKGKPADPAIVEPPPADESVISEANLKIAASKAVEKTPKIRKDIDQKMRKFGLKVSVRINGHFEEV